MYDGPLMPVLIIVYQIARLYFKKKKRKENGLLDSKKYSHIVMAWWEIEVLTEKLCKLKSSSIHFKA